MAEDTKKKRKHSLGEMANMAGETGPGTPGASYMNAKPGAAPQRTGGDNTMSQTLGRVNKIRNANNSTPPSTQFGESFSTAESKQASAAQGTGGRDNQFTTLGGGDFRDNPGGVTGPTSGDGGEAELSFSSSGAGHSAYKRPPGESYGGDPGNMRSKGTEGSTPEAGGVVNPASLSAAVAGGIAGANPAKPGVRTQTENMVSLAIQNILGGMRDPGMGDFDQKYYAKLLGIGQ